MVKKFISALSLLYLILLVYNLFAAQFTASAVSLILFLITCPYFLKKTKESYPLVGKIAVTIGWIPLIFIISSIVVGTKNENSDEIAVEINSRNSDTVAVETNNENSDEIPTETNNENRDEIPPEEQLYIDTILSQITSETTKEEAIELLGKPSRDLALKVNWWVSISNRNSRVGVYFSTTTGKAVEVVLDGGWGNFYYREKLIE